MKFCLALRELLLSGTMPITKTGSSYNYSSVRDRNANLASKYRLSRTPKPMEHRPTWSYIKVIWILLAWKHGNHETGSSYCYASERDRNAILTSKYRFSSTPKPMEYRPTWSSVKVIWILPTWKHEDHETGSSYYYASVRDRNPNLTSKYRFPWTANSMEHRPTWSSARVISILSTWEHCEEDVEISQNPLQFIAITTSTNWFRIVGDVGRRRE